MKRCLRCGNMRTDAFIFCDGCQTELLHSSERTSFQTLLMPSVKTNFLPATKMIQDGDIDSRPLGMRPLPWVSRQAEARRRRKIFIAIAVIVLMLLVVDGILATLVITHEYHLTQSGDILPSLTLLGAVYGKQVTQVHLSHFIPSWMDDG